ncbi:MAG: hypothetical protein LBE20_01150 [Deltaproteobacteria bacterium]|jgi:hypothetical protein|nr:hypothetical protein [Deltaproteobacteria bacterium]
MSQASPFDLVFIFFCLIVLGYCILAAYRGKNIFVRKISGIAAIDETIGRSIELGRPISFTSGLASIGPVFYACLSVLQHIARKVASFNAKLFVPCYDPETLVLSDITIQNAYKKEKRFANYDPGTTRYLSSSQFAFASGYIGIIQRENVGGAFLFGTYAAESLILASAGQEIGAMQVAATTSNEQIPFFITTCDYTLIGEELFAAGAYLSQDPVQTGSLKAQDIIKSSLLVLIIVGVLISTGISILDKPDSKNLSFKTWSKQMEQNNFLAQALKSKW